MNRDGFISVIGVIIIGLIFFSCLYLLYFSSLQTPLTTSTLENLQSRYLMEEKLYRLILDKDLFDTYLRYHILDRCRGSFPPDLKWKLCLKDEPKLNKNFISGYFSQPNRNDLNKIIINMEYEFGNIKRGIEAELSTINYFLNSDKNIIRFDDLFEEEIPLFESMMENLHELSFNYDSRPTISYLVHNLENDAILENYRSNKKLSALYCNNNVKVREYSYEVLILYLMDPFGHKLNLTIGREGDGSILKTKGVFYIEGDLIINQQLELDGIIIINGGKIIVNSSQPALINGMIIYNGDSELDEDKIIVVNNKNNIINYGSCLPIFLDPLIKMIKYY